VDADPTGQFIKLLGFWVPKCQVADHPLVPAALVARACQYRVDANGKLFTVWYGLVIPLISTSTDEKPEELDI
jgi:hypothetical protein